ncbi:MAG TPA: carboxypeptidase regulatory-like domain-containing protein, partial [Bryobacteraceae bacterium]|nr:carboxypeptidase regulatory-like domain-containing protein [Bryobacteraceae bacterium]
MRFRIALYGVCLFVLSTAGWAQTAQIQGTVYDSSGAAVPGAQVKVTQTDTGAARTAVSAADGSYVLANLPIGPYRLEAGKEGFTTYVRTGIVLQVDASPMLDISLSPGSVTDQVEVQANAGLVETSATNIGQVMENQRLVDLPLNGRNVVDLVNLTPGVVQAGTSSSGNIPTGALFSIAGSQTFGTTYYMDGAVYGGGLNLPFPFPDALEEFKVEAASLSAANGIHEGAAVTAVTKSGTNSFHGDVFEFLRNGDLNARNFFAAQRDTLKRNTYGGVIGGPIKKNKLFFFFGYQANKLRSDPVATTAFVPTAQMLAGDWTAYASPACNGGKQLNLPAPFAANRISPALYSPAALKIASHLPATADPCGKTLFGAVTKSNDQQFLGRVDYQISPRHTLFGRNMALPFNQPAPYGISGNILATSVAGLNNFFQNYIAGDTFLVNAGTVSSFRLSMARTATQRFNPDFFSGCDLGVQMYCFLPHQSAFTVTGAFSISGGTMSKNSPADTVYEAGEDLNLVRGAHQISFGALVFDDRNNNRANVFSIGSFTFNGTALGVPMADFLLGQLDSFVQGTPNTGFSTRWYLGVYAADSWKISPRLTINYGLRWEPNFQTQVINGDVYDFSPAGFLAGRRSTVFPNAPAGVYWPGDPGVPDNSGVNRRFDQFAPRVGLAWDPSGKGTWSIRAAWGIAYDTTGGSLANTETAPPWGDMITVAGPVPFTTPWATTPGGNPFPACGSNPCGKTAGFVPNGTYISLQPDMKSTTVNLWNLAIQRQIGQSWVLSGTYIGSETEHLWMTKQLNPGQFLGLSPCTLPLSGTRVWNPCSQTGNLPDRRLFSLIQPSDGQLIGFMDQMDAGGTASYHGLLLSAQKRFSSGLAVVANYTWSHCIGDLTQGSGVNGGGAGYQDPNNRRLDRGNCASQEIAGVFGTDRRQLFNLTLVAETPRFASRWLRTVGTGWRLAPIFRAYSGGFVSLATGVDRALTGNQNQRPNQVLADVYCANPNPHCYLNPAAFAQPALGTLGNLGKFNILTPGQWTLDTTLSRLFRVREG